ncbi:hypothetical protein D9E92_21090 [Escherichia coli]|nr:hypothetical protein [Escherichia coli]EHJ7972153.1 hypothetical protein [Escherichia coli]HBH4644688.1 hypothetical protein [Escherichia coli]HDP7487725.1 hypothetical protein [Escherichia coli]
MAESGYGLAGLGMGKVKSISPYRLTPGFGGFTPVSYATTECRLPCRWRGICWWLCLKGYILCIKPDNTQITKRISIL